MLQNAVSSGIASAGVDVTKVGVITSAGLCYLTQTLNFDLGVMITASHNAPEYNGIKIFDKDGFKLSIEKQNEIENLINTYDKNSHNSKKFGNIYFKPKLKEKYVNFLCSCCNKSLKNKHYIFDCANGAGVFFAKKVFSKLGATVECINCGGGENINVNCGATNPKTITDYVKNNYCDIGFSLDGDADRLIVCDKFANIVDGDDLLFLLATNFKGKNILNSNTVVGTVMNNLGLEKELKKHNINFVRVNVGDKNIINYLSEHCLSLGGEQSGHTIFYNQLNSADGILTALNIAMLEIEENKSLDMLNVKFKHYPQVKINIGVNSNNIGKITKNNQLKNLVEKLEKSITNGGRIVVRASGTEPIIRIMVEGENENEITIIAQKISNFVKNLA